MITRKAATQALCLVSLAVFAACGQTPIIERLPLVRKELAKEQTIDCQGVTRVVIQIPRGSIAVRCDGGRSAATVQSKRFAYGPGQEEATRRAREITLDVTRNGPLLSIIAALPSAPQDEALGVDLVVALPPSASFELNCDQGDIELRGAVGDVRATSRIGGMELSGITGTLTVEAKRGDVSIRDVSGAVQARVGTGDSELYRVGDVDARTRVGALKLYHPLGRVALQTVRGDVLVQAPKLNARPTVVIKTGTGGVTLMVPKTVACHLKLRTGKGQVTAFLDRVQIRDVVATEQSYVATLNGGGGKIHASVTEGPITIQGVGTKLVR